MRKLVLAVGVTIFSWSVGCARITPDFDEDTLKGSVFFAGVGAGMIALTLRKD